MSLDNVLSQLMALKLGAKPDSPEAHGQIRLWLQDQLDRAADPGRIRVSQWLHAQVVFAIADTNLSKQYDDWFMSGL